MRRAFIVATVAGGLLAACAPLGPPRPDGDAQPPPEFPAAYYRQVAASGQAVFAVDPAASLVVIEVRRAGSLAHLGHDHVVASHDVHGYVAPDEGRADLYVRLDALAVDEPELRAESNFDTQPSAAAIAGTRENMLGKFHADEHPYALVSVRRADADGSRFSAAVTLNGITRTVSLAVPTETATDRLDASGRFTLAQTAFGITPFSILGGALQVEDEFAVRFVIRARRPPS